MLRHSDHGRATVLVSTFLAPVPCGVISLQDHSIDRTSLAFPRVGSITIGSQGDQSARWPIRLHHRTYEVENGTILGVVLPQCGDEKLFPQACNDEVSAGGHNLALPGGYRGHAYARHEIACQSLMPPTMKRWMMQYTRPGVYAMQTQNRNKSIHNDVKLGG